ncbi:hypothetical protein BCBMB205_35640 [Bacillus sp. CN2]|nr:hypothetical protein BCBMB205_35640 [Bacillus velezensis]ARZ59910.1 hypothetical protein BAGQ_3706 [Bacillus velezensis]RAP13416.1 hypothetical protein HS9_02407 [Bacillus velezensis]RAP18501.1 hypothetical protein C2W63_02678 [Bacillus velezensis]GFR54978.1 hypothetical protein BCBMB205_35640 [Bacillus sp. CN2]
MVIPKRCRRPSPPSPHEMLSDKSYSTVNGPIPFAEITDFSFFSSTNV